MRYRILLYIITAFISTTAVAQQSSAPKGMQRIGIDSADYIRNIIIDDISIERLIGNVVLSHNNAVMFCDSAYLYPNNLFEAYGNVHLKNKTTTVTGDVLTYNGNTNLAQIRGYLVHLIDSVAVLRTNSIDYNTKENIGFFENEGTIKNAESIIESKHGYYYSATKDFVFIGNVEAETENYTLSSDSMKYNIDTETFNFYSHTHIWSDNNYLYCDNGWYNSKYETLFFLKNSYMLSEQQEVLADSIYYESLTSEGKLYGNIQILDTTQNILAFGDYAEFNTQQQNFEITRDPSMVLFPKNQGEDTSFLRADRIKSIVKPRLLTDSIKAKTDSLEIKANENIEVKTNENTEAKTDSTFREVFGLKNVRIFRPDFQLICDSIYFNTVDSIWKIHHNPVMWNGEGTQLFSDTIKFFMVNETIDRALFENNSMLIMLENGDSIKYYNQIKGRNMIAYLKNNELQKFDVLGNVQSLFFSGEEQVMIPHEAANMSILFKNKKIRRIGYYNQPEAKAIPLFMTSNDEQKLPGFVWHNDKRPKSKKDILTRTIRASKRSMVEAITQPVFPITMRINLLEESKKNNTENIEPASTKTPINN